MKNKKSDIIKSPIYDFEIVDNQKIIIDKKGIYNFNYNANTNYNIEILILTNVTATINNYLEIEGNLNINLEVNGNCNIDFNIYNYHQNSKNITINIEKDSFLRIYTIELSEESFNNYSVNLLGENSQTDVNLSIYADNKNKHIYNIIVNHLKPYSKSNIINRGILDNEADCKLEVKSFIKKGCFKTMTYQKNQFLTFSDDASINISPILLIDDYDVIAGHGASVSKVSDDDKYYLKSRGLNDDDIRKIIIIGHLLESSPIYMRDKLEKILERRMKDGKISS